MGAVPYVDPLGGLYDGGTAGRNRRALFSSMWFTNGPIAGSNYLHLMGVRGKNWGGITGQMAGDTLPENAESMVFIATWETRYPTASDSVKAVQAATDHELAHNFGLNACALVDDCSTQSAANHHDYRPWWNFSTIGCPAQNANPCLMDPFGGAVTSGTNRFCKEDLLLGDPKAPCSNYTKDETAIRTVEDPLPMKGLS